MDDYNLIDMGCTGPKLTWTKRRNGLTKTLVRLDRALANLEWHVMFPNACVRNLPRTSLDHSPVLVALEGMSANCNFNKPFRLSAGCFKHPNFSSVVEESWNLNLDLPSNISYFTAKAKLRNKEVYGNIFDKKKELKLDSREYKLLKRIISFIV